jgi:glycosyltransferase involved in cell wall biosynthesis
MRTVFFFRRANAPWHHSIEELFDTIISALPDQVDPVRYVMKKNSTGLWRRIYNTIDVAFHQGEVNHITGDVHYIAAFMKKRKTILTIHDLRILSSGGGVRLALLKFFWFTMPGWRVRYITVISEYIRQEMIEKTGIPPDQIVVVYDCISAAIAPSVKEFNSERPVILHIGTTPNKNLERVIPALAGLEITLSIVGKLTPGHLELLRIHNIFYENYYNLQYHEVVDKYRKADIVLFPSLYEGFGLPILEANAVGRPVITSNRTSLPEVAGDAALIIDPEDTAAIRQAVIRLMGDAALRADLVGKGFQNVKRFHPDEIGKKYAAIYAELAKSKS